MDISESLKTLLKDNDKNSDQITGDYHVVQWSPDPFGFERLNIGVVFISNKNGIPVYKFLEDTSIFNKLYNKDVSFHVNLACECAKVTIDNHGIESLNFPNCKQVNGGFAKGKDSIEIIDQLYKSFFDIYR